MAAIQLLSYEVARGSLATEWVTCPNCHEEIHGYNDLEGSWVQCLCTGGYVGTLMTLRASSPDDDLNTYFLIDAGMFGEKKVCSTCRTDYYAARPKLAGPFTSFSCQCEECGN